jgi:hypothetical protein
MARRFEDNAMSPNKSSAKSTAIQIIQDQPDDSTTEDLIEQLLLHRMIERGLADVDAARTIPLSELKRRMATWRK